MDETKIIEKFFERGFYPLDDCFFDKENLLNGGNIIITTDSIASGIHFREDWSSPEDVAYKLIEVNLSDILSSGGIPIYAFLNLGLSPHTAKENWVQPFSQMLKKRLNHYKTKLVGGDTFRAGENATVLTLTLMGKLHPHLSQPWVREGGKAGDAIYLSGPVGYSQWGYELLRTHKKPKNKLEKKAIQKHLRPTSRWDLFPSMKSLPIHGCMDITDGLVQDLNKLAVASGLLLEIYVERLPDYFILQDKIDSNSILTSGEELELVVLGSIDSEKEFLKAGFTKIGQSYPIPPKHQRKNKKNKFVQFLLEGKELSLTHQGFVHFNERI